jgi:hypothetical protein
MATEKIKLTQEQFETLKAGIIAGIYDMDAAEIKYDLTKAQIHEINMDWLPTRF